VIEIKSFRMMRQGVEMDFAGFDPDTDEAVEIRLVIPPLSFDSLQLLETELRELPDKTPAELLAIVRRIAREALRRNYRNVPDWLIRQTVDYDNFNEVLSLDVSGLKRQERDAGKAMAAEKTGTASTVT
jgi:hypothetical protein